MSCDIVYFCLVSRELLSNTMNPQRHGSLKQDGDYIHLKGRKQCVSSRSSVNWKGQPRGREKQPLTVLYDPLAMYVEQFGLIKLWYLATIYCWISSTGEYTKKYLKWWRNLYNCSKWWLSKVNNELFLLSLIS